VGLHRPRVAVVVVVVVVVADGVVRLRHELR